MDQETLLASLAPEIQKIDSCMQAELANTGNPLLKEVVSHAIFNGGKRIRPLLTILASRLIATRPAGAEANNTDDNRLYQLASIFEYLHAASLLHDDVIDHAGQRRGKPSANALWDNTIVILAGDYLHTRAMTLAGTAGGTRCLEIIGAATAAMISAEFLQLQNLETINYSEENYYAVLQGKTASLIAAACEVGVIHTGGDEPACQALRTYGANLGIAFQLVDDLLDYLGDAGKTGKKIGNDFQEGKLTLPLIHTLATADARDQNFIMSLLNGDSKDRLTHFNAVRDLIQTNHGFDYTRKAAENLIEKAGTALALFSKSSARDMLTALTQYVLRRNK